MLQQQTSTSGLDRAIQRVRRLALQEGRHELVAGLETALTSSCRDFEIDVLASEIRRAGSIVPCSRGERALLIVLALQKRPCTRDELTDMLYPHLEPLTAIAQLKVYVHRVRRRLENPAVIVFKAESYRLGSNVVCDLWDIENEVALAMRTRGELDELSRRRLESIRERLVRRDISWIDDREWCSNLDRRLKDMTFDVSVRLGEAALAAGDVQTVSKLATAIFELDPCDERGAELAIRGHLARGDKAAAIRQLRRYERTLRLDFDAEPSSTLVELCQGPCA